MKNIFTIITAIVLCFTACAQQVESEIKAETAAQHNYEAKLLVKDLSIPWGLTFLPDGSLLITEKHGELIHFKNNKKTSISGLPENIYVRGQGGLLDVAIHPDYTKNGWIYFTYSSSPENEEGGNTTLMRAKLDGKKLVKKEILYQAGPNTTKGHHFGSRIEFDNDGYLFFSIGDRGNRDENPQDITRDCGKIYRLHDDGSIPKDNPFVGVKNAKEAIYSYGHRNPQGMCKHPETGAIWTHEHGPRGGDEINIIQPNKNYGWPKITYGINYSGTIITKKTALPKMEQPLFYWVPSIAPSGMTFVSSDKYPEWRNSILVGSLKFQYIERLVLKNNTVVKREKLFEELGRIRNIEQGPDGYLYVAAEGKGIFRILPKN